MKQQLIVTKINQQTSESCNIYLDQDPNFYIYTYLVYANDDDFIVYHGVMGNFQRYIKVRLSMYSKYKGSIK